MHQPGACFFIGSDQFIYFDLHNGGIFVQHFLKNEENKESDTGNKVTDNSMQVLQVKFWTTQVNEHNDNSYHKSERMAIYPDKALCKSFKLFFNIPVK